MGLAALLKIYDIRSGLVGKDNLLWCSVNKKGETFQRVTPALVTLQLDYYNTFHIGLPLNITQKLQLDHGHFGPFQLRSPNQRKSFPCEVERR